MKADNVIMDYEIINKNKNLEEKRPHLVSTPTPYLFNSTGEGSRMAQVGSGGKSERPIQTVKLPHIQPIEKK